MVRSFIDPLERRAYIDGPLSLLAELGEEDRGHRASGLTDLIIRERQFGILAGTGWVRRIQGYAAPNPFGPIEDSTQDLLQSISGDGGSATAGASGATPIPGAAWVQGLGTDSNASASARYTSSDNYVKFAQANGDAGDPAGTISGAFTGYADNALDDFGFGEVYTSAGASGFGGGGGDGGASSGGRARRGYCHYVDDWRWIWCWWRLG